MRCDRCEIDVIKGEMTMHRMTEHCRRTHYERQQAICEFCSHLEVSCKRCDAWLSNRPNLVKSLDDYIKNNEHGVLYIKHDLRTKLINIEYRRKYKDMPDEEIPIDTSCPFYRANMEDIDGEFNDSFDGYY